MDNKEQAVEYEYGGFWIRLTAFLIDLVAVVIIVTLAHALLAEIPGAPSEQEFSQMGPFNFLLMSSYFALMEATPMRATLGKRLVGLAVVDGKGGKVSLLMTFVRNLSKIVSAAIFYVGFFMIGFTRQKQGLHDLFAGTLVVYRSSLPAAEFDSGEEPQMSEASRNGERAFREGRYKEAIDYFKQAVAEGSLDEKHIAMYQQARRRMMGRE